MLHRTPLFLALAPLLAQASAAQSDPALHRVREIRLASFGSSNEATRFRRLLQDALRNNGFEAVGACSDATLTGTFSSESHGDYSSAHATPQLKSRDGKQTLWSGDYASQHKGNIPEDVIQTLANTCAERLHHD